MATAIDGNWNRMGRSSAVALGDGICQHGRMSTLGQRVRDARIEEGMGVNDLDRAAGFSKGTTSRIENGQRGSKTGGWDNTISKLARALGRREEWLRDGVLPQREPAAGMDRPGVVADHPDWPSVRPRAVDAAPDLEPFIAELGRSSLGLQGTPGEIDVEMILKIARELERARKKLARSDTRSPELPVVLHK